MVSDKSNFLQLSDTASGGGCQILKAVFRRKFFEDESSQKFAASCSNSAGGSGALITYPWR
jgi:hypothetical protein